ncbi:uncharacterized protein LOC133373488 [Rhineura floridana]|uniref:uncharacterized protein LOC133373488 n=1 Tax=Rhineura floridana TaxID=261503 RepID=UPI002AC88FEF|nr:uncharacterized protein LOC133373488 [Rhineura floridana]
MPAAFTWPSAGAAPPQRRRQLRGRVLILTVCAAGIGGTFQYGYNLTIINAPSTFIQTFTNETWLERTGSPLEGRVITLIWSFIVSIYSLGGLVGALLAGPMAIKLGRKTSLLLNNLFVVFAALMVGFSRMAKSFEMILLSRFFAGINSGVAMSIQPMYLGESAPKEFRGAMALTSASFTALGLVLGQVVGLREILGAEEIWPLLLASNVVPALIQLLLLPWAPESPRYLLIDREDQESCICALRKLRGGGDLSSEMEEMLAEQEALRGEVAKTPWALFAEPAVRWQLITIVVLSSAMQLCGNDSMYFYASYVFQKAGIPDDKIQYSVIGTGSCELITAMTCNVIIERAGRRMLVVGGYSLMAVWAIVFMVSMSLQDQFNWMPYLSMACIFAYILSFGIGPAGVTGIIPTEIFDQVSRPAAYMICGSLLWTNLFLVGMAFPFLVEGLGQYCYLPFFTVCVCAALYVGFFLPETKGKTFLEISAEFNKRNFKAQACENSWSPSEETKSTMLYVMTAFVAPSPTDFFGPWFQDSDGMELFGIQFRRVFQMILVVGMGGTLLIGFQFSVITYPSQDIKRFINKTWVERHGSPLCHETLTLLWSSIVSVYCLGGLLGCLLSAHLTTRYGKKKTLMCNDLVIITAALLIGFSEIAKSFEMILIGRFLYGFSAGICLNGHGPYVGEISPKKWRGFAMATTSVFFSLGKALGQIMGLRDLFGTEALWPLLLALCGFPALLQFLLLPFFPESPPYLLIQKEDKEGCLKALKYLWGDAPCQAELEDMMKQKAAARGSKSLGVLELMKEQSLRWPLGIAILLIATLNLCGLSAIYFYTFEVFRTAKLEEALIPYVALGVGTCEFAATILCSSIIDRLGRRILLWGGFGMMAVVLALFVLALSLQDQFPWVSFCSIGLIFLFTLFYGLGPSGAIFSVIMEVFSQSARPSALTIIGTISWVGLFVVGMSFPFVVEALGHFSFLIFLAVLVVVGSFIYMYLPETKGRSISDITEELNRIRLGKKFICSTQGKTSSADHSFCTKL